MGYRNIVRPLLEEFVDYSKNGELIISNNSAHICVRNDNAIVSSTKDTERRFKHSEEHYDWIEKSLELLEQDPFEDNDLFDPNFDIKDLTKIISTIEGKLNKVYPSINDILNNIDSLEKQINQDIYENDEHSIIIERLNVNNMPNLKREHNIAEYTVEKVNQRVLEAELLGYYIKDIQNLCNEEYDKLKERHKKNVEHYKSLARLGDKNSNNQDEYYGFVNTLKSKYDSLRSLSAEAGINISFNLSEVVK